MDFLSDSRRAVDITPSSQGAVPCSIGISKTSKQTCNQVFFMPGQLMNFGLLGDATGPEADLFVVSDKPGYVLNFTALQQGLNSV